MSGFSAVTPRERAAWALRAAIRAAAVEAFDAHMVEQEVPGLRSRMSGLDDPLAGVCAAVLVRDVAVGQMLAHAQDARAAGRSWDEVADALDIPSSAEGAPRGELAFLLLVEGRPLPEEERSWWDRGTAWWTCTACRRRVSDAGPFESHPDDNETGHAPSCPRRAAALTAWKAETDEPGEIDEAGEVTS